MKSRLISLSAALFFIFSHEVTFAQSQDITNQMPQIRKGNMINAAPQPVQSNPIRMSPDGSKGTIPITKDYSAYGQKGPTTQPGEISIQGGLEIQTK